MWKLFNKFHLKNSIFKLLSRFETSIHHLMDSRSATRVTPRESTIATRVTPRESKNERQCLYQKKNITDIFELFSFNDSLDMFKDKISDSNVPKTNELLLHGSQQASLGERHASPVLRSATPVLRSATPVLRSATPVKRGSTPVERGATPVERGATPVERGATPVERGATPVERGASHASPVLCPPFEEITETEKIELSLVYSRNLKLSLSNRKKLNDSKCSDTNISVVKCPGETVGEIPTLSNVLRHDPCVDQACGRSEGACGGDNIPSQPSQPPSSGYVSMCSTAEKNEERPSKKQTKTDRKGKVYKDHTCCPIDYDPIQLRKRKSRKRQSSWRNDPYSKQAYIWYSSDSDFE